MTKNKSNQPIDKLMKALELRQAGRVHALSATHYRVGSGTRPNKSYSVGMRGGTYWCSCPDAELRQHICKHQLASLFYPALIACLQFAWATDLEQLEITAELHKDDLLAMPEAVRDNEGEGNKQ